MSGKHLLRRIALMGIRPTALHAVSHTYDPGGRLVDTSQGAGLDARSVSLGYYASGPNQGYLESLTDALGHTLAFEPVARRMRRIK